MPIGKNSIKRVANNGYSKVASAAPDMENSTVLANPAPEIMEMVASKSTDTRKTPVKKNTALKSAPAKKNVAKPQKKATAKSDTEYVNIGRELPTYLL